MTDASNDFLWHVGIVGAGRMGMSIFDYIFTAGLRITWVAGSPEKADELRKKADKMLKRLFKQGIKSADEVQKLDESIFITDDYSELAGADVIIEAVAENAEIKKTVLTKIFKAAQSSAIVATNSASIMPSELSEADIDARRFFGLHFFFPVEATGVAELISNEAFTAQNLKKAGNFARDIGLLTVNQDETNAFLLSALAMPMAGEAFLLAKRVGFKLANKIASSELLPYGPFYLFDQAGVDATIESCRRCYGRDLLGGRDRYSQLLCFMKLMADSAAEGDGRPSKFLNGAFEYPHDLEAWRRQEIFSLDSELDDENHESLRKRFFELLLGAFLRATQNNLVEPDLLNEAWKRIAGAVKGPLECVYEGNLPDFKARV
ncbi:hypothetical protein EPN18_03560 [bacterium]|nr:MAG: hypothetical protein EPN18_03560 [bacterium]